MVWQHLAADLGGFRMKLKETEYHNFWGIKQAPKFTEMELALMEGGHSLQQAQKEDRFTFLKLLSENKNASK